MLVLVIYTTSEFDLSINLNILYFEKFFLNIKLKTF